MSIQPEYRLYIDEVGNADLNASKDPNHQYLSLTGVILKLDYARGQVSEELEALKHQFFKPDSNKPIIFHRKELSRQKYPFEALKDPLIRANFDGKLLFLLTEWDYRVITVVIDKLAHLRKYTRWQVNPYHYCLEVMLERYARWLESLGSCGDVVAESRGNKEDRMLKESFKRLYTQGNYYTQAKTFKGCLTTNELKLKPKLANSAGLQIADLLAHPSYRAMKMMAEGHNIPEDFGRHIYNILNERKYHRSSSGRIEGYGRKWLP